MSYGTPIKQGLYDPAQEKDACGVGFIADIKGRRDHGIVADALKMLEAMDHRGACGCEANTGDGAGILTALPHDFIRKMAKAEFGVDLPEPGRFGAGNLFLPQDARERRHCKRVIEKIVTEQGQRLVGWRVVPVDPDKANVGPTALPRASTPRPSSASSTSSASAPPTNSAKTPN
jgi:glutamate synthase (NADPH/NADH) large chain